MDAEATARYIVREFCGYEPADVIATVAAALREAHAAGRRAGLGEAAVEAACFPFDDKFKNLMTAKAADVRADIASRIRALAETPDAH